MDLQVTRESDAVHITLTGDLVFNSVEGIRARILEEMEDAGTLYLTLGAIGEFDLTGVQLLYALCRWNEKAGKSVAIDPGETAPRINKMLRFAGLSPIGCVKT